MVDLSRTGSQPRALGLICTLAALFIIGQAASGGWGTNTTFTANAARFFAENTCLGNGTYSTFSDPLYSSGIYTVGLYNPTRDLTSASNASVVKLIQILFSSGKVECQDGAGPAINLRGSTGIYAYSTPYTSNGRTVQYPTLGFFGAQAINTVVSPIANSFYVWQEGNNFRTFTDVNTFPDIPVARVHMSSSIDKSKPQLNNPEEGLSYVPIYLFGGYGQSGPNVTFYNEMYLSTQNGNDYITGWELVAPSASSPVPEPRADHRVVSINDTMYLFGGRDDEGVFGDTWSYSYTNSTWKKLFDFGKVLFEDGDLEDNIQTPENASFPHSPPARYGHSMIDISDSDSNIVGGLTKLIVMVGGTNGNHTFNDLWGFDPKSQNWSQIVLPIAYPARHGSAFIRGPDSGTDLYLYGGELTNGTDPTVYYNDIFYLDLSGPQGPTPSFKRTPNAIIAGVAGGILLVLIIMVIVLKCTDRNSS